MYGRKWKPGKTAARAFAAEMDNINNFCAEHGIQCSRSNDSYYFRLNGVNYRISNHSIESSNAHAVNADGIQIRDKYHPDNREADTVYIHASKTRIIEIYTALIAGKKLDGRGFEI